MASWVLSAKVLVFAGVHVRLHARLDGQFLGTRAERDGFVLLVAFLVSFLFIRSSARLIRSPKVPWWPGSVKTGGGLHIHHLVWGIVLVLISGFLGFALNAQSPWSEVLAAAFGVGAGLTLDEFALWLRLEDVYWAQEGRQSLDAVVVAALLGGLIVVGLAPFDTSGSSPGLGLMLALLLNVLLCVVAIAKGKPILGLIGVFIPLVALVASVRLASPSSPWARRRYRPGRPKLARSRARFARSRARRQRVMDAVAGAPETAIVTPPAGRADERDAT